MINFGANCTKCDLSMTRRNVVWGEGESDVPLMLVGEAPGAAEDMSGSPFAGAPGKLMRRMLLESGWTSEEVYITNRVKCRPPTNRDPLPGEQDSCAPWLVMEITAIRPKIILFLGRVAGTIAHVGVEKLTEQHRIARAMTFGGHTVLTLVTYHPGYALRNGDQAQDIIRNDLKLVRLLANGLVAQ